MCKLVPEKFASGSPCFPVQAFIFFTDSSQKNIDISIQFPYSPAAGIRIFMRDIFRKESSFQ